MTLLPRFLWFLPRNVLVVVLRAYRAVISPLYGDVCRYYPSCSSYSLQAVQQLGVVRGAAAAVWRVLRCHPWAAGGVDDVVLRRAPYVVTPFGFVTGARAEAAPASVSGSTHTHVLAHSHGKG